MASLRGVQTQIRFQLSQLAATNAHHEFEKLSLGIARIRICSNIIPATGPVSSGGDQGRDFETFRTYIKDSPLGGRAFLGRSTSETLVFACTTAEPKKLESKIKADIKTIMERAAGLQTAQRIYIFCTSDLAAGKRHRIQRWAHEKYNVPIEVLDGTAISVILADRDIFYLATEFLYLPSDIYPRHVGADEPQWYKDLLEKWKDKAPGTHNYGDFEEIKAAARYATRIPPSRIDLPFWLSLLNKFKTTSPFSHLRRRAVYEFAVASLRGLNTLERLEDEMREYFRGAPSLLDPAEFEDASILLTYISGALVRNLIALAPEELLEWHNSLTEAIDVQLEQATQAGRRCALLEVRARLAFMPRPGSSRTQSINDAFAYWRELVTYVPRAPLYPLERFSDFLNRLPQLIGEHPQYASLVQRVDSLVAQRHGESKAAENARDRALSFHEQGRILRAISELHSAMGRWFAQETLYGSLLAMMLIARWYREIGLVLAGKYYALAAAWIADFSHEPKPQRALPSAIMLAADADYAGGAWIGFLVFAEKSLTLHGVLSSSDGESAEGDLRRAIFHATTILTFADRYAPELRGPAARAVERWKVEDVLEELLLIAGDQWNSPPGNTDLWTAAEQQLWGPPFSDVTTAREMAWRQLGVHWRMLSPNNYDTTAGVEELVATMQITYAELARVDLCITPTSVSLKARLGGDGQIHLKCLDSSVGREWEVLLPVEMPTTPEHRERYRASLIWASVAILRDVALAPAPQFDQAIEDLFRTGLAGKIYVGQEYRTIFRRFIGPEDFRKQDRENETQLYSGRTFAIREHPELAGHSGPGPGYSSESSRHFIAKR